jgi:hypothetical protein
MVAHSVGILLRLILRFERSADGGFRHAPRSLPDVLRGRA